MHSHQGPQSQNRLEPGAVGTAGIGVASALTFSGVSVALGGRPVLDKLDLDLVPGEIMCLLGDSGSGKSTILRVAAGLQDIDAGSVRINGALVSAAGVTVAAERRGVGLMFQDFALFPHLSLLQNVKFGLNALDRRAARDRALSALARVGLDERQADFPHMLSGGQQQRLALARSIAPRPGILLLDEPFSGLDSRLRETVREKTLAVLRDTRATSIIVTHDPEEAMVLGDRIALLRDGWIVQIGTATQVYHHPVDLDAARFFSPLSEITSTVQSGAATSPFGPVPVTGRADGNRVILGFRPVGNFDLRQKGPGILGRIVSVRTALGTDILEVLVDGMAKPLRLRQPAGSALQPGKDIFLVLKPQHILVFDAV